MAELSTATLDLVRTLQAASDCLGRLEALAEEWKDRENFAFCHNDIRWSNIIRAGDGRGRTVWLRLIDWETGGWADPAWDIGSVFGWMLTKWALGVAAERHGGQPLYDAADKVLDRLYPAVQGFWSGYMTTAKIADAAALLERSVRYAGARLIQTAFERSQTSDSLGPPEYLLLQLAANLLARPRDAEVHVLRLGRLVLSSTEGV